MFIRNRKMRGLAVLACALFVTFNLAVFCAHAQQKPVSKAAAAKAANVQLSFNNADMHEFVNSMAGLLGLTPMLIDPSVQGTVNTGNIAIPRDDLFDLFNAILKTRSVALVRQDNIFQVVPVSSAIRNNLEIIEDPPNLNVGGDPHSVVLPVAPFPRQEDSITSHIATHVIRLDFVPVDEIVAAVQLLVSDGVSIITFRRQNLMIFTDYTNNAARVREIARMFDNSFLDPDHIELVRVEYSNAADVADELRKIFGSGADGASTGPLFVPLERLNAIFVMAASRRGLDEVKRWIEELDAFDGGKFQTFVYVVQDSTASQIAMMLDALYSDDGTDSAARVPQTQGVLGGTANMLGNQFGGGFGGTFGTAQQLGPRLETSAASVTSMILRGGPFSSLRDEVRVVVDDINNVLHIQATLADYRVLLSAIERMDMPPRQVLIDVQIFQADLTDELNYGFRGVLEELRTGNMTTAGMAGMTENNAGLLSFDTFASVGNSRQISLGLAALKTRTNVRSLENPQLMAMDGTPASFVSGAEVPYPTDSFASTIGVTSGMAYRETGVNLQIVPRISASGTVRLEIVQEVSTVSTVAGLNNAPVFPLTQVQTTLSVRDGETVAIAGLISDNSRWGRSGIPFLSEIPFIGGLFGATSRNNQRTELIILLTPHVIGTQDRFQEVTHGLRDSLRNVRRLIDEHERNSIRDIEDARRERERRELNEIRNIRPPR